MGLILASAIFSKASELLTDTGNGNWTVPDLLGWLNSGQREIVVWKPNACTKNESVLMVAGSKQALPAAGLVLIDVIRNMGADGATPGNAVTGIGRDVLDTVLPGWHSSSSSAAAKKFVYDVRDPKNYYLYPPQPANTTQRLEIIYSVTPVDLTSQTQAIAVDDIYEGCLINYILYRAHSRNDGSAGGTEQAVLHFQAFQSALGVKLKGETGFKPPKSQPEAGLQG